MVSSQAQKRYLWFIVADQYLDYGGIYALHPPGADCAWKQRELA